MIEHIDISGVGAYKLDESAKNYIKKKIGKLDRLLLLIDRYKPHLFRR